MSEINNFIKRTLLKYWLFFFILVIMLTIFTTMLNDDIVTKIYYSVTTCGLIISIFLLIYKYEEISNKNHEDSLNTKVEEFILQFDSEHLREARVFTRQLKNELSNHTSDEIIKHINDQNEQNYVNL